MKQPIAVLTFLFLTLQLSAQITFDVSEFEFEQDSIISISVGDPDNNLRDDVFVTVHGKDLVYKLQNGANGFSKTFYLSKDQPELFEILSLNGGDDIVFTEKGKSDINIMYGKDEYYTEKRIWGALTLDSSVIIKSIEVINPEEYIYSNILLYAIDQNNTFHIYKVTASSFNSIAPYFIDTFKADFEVGQTCGYYTDDRVTRIFFPDMTNGQLKVMKNDWNAFNTPLDTNLVTIDKELERPVGCITSFSDIDGDVMFVMDASKPAIYKYYLEDNYRREEYLIEMDNPTKMATGFIDDNDFIDMLVLDGNKLWLISDLHEGRLGVTQTLLVEETAPIKELIVLDYNKDGLTDVIYNLQGGNSVKVLKNDFVSSNIDLNESNFKIYPNPTNAVIHIEGKYDQLKIYDINGNIVNFKQEGNTIIFDEILKGHYVVKVGYQGEQKSKILLVK